MGHCVAPSRLRKGPTRSGRSFGNVKLDQTLLAQFPEGYRHLAYLQTKIGYKVKRNMPGLDGPDLDALYTKGEAWLKGRKL